MTLPAGPPRGLASSCPASAGCGLGSSPRHEAAATALAGSSSFAFARLRGQAARMMLAMNRLIAGARDDDARVNPSAMQTRAGKTRRPPHRRRTPTAIARSARTDTDTANESPPPHRGLGPWRPLPAAGEAALRLVALPAAPGDALRAGPAVLHQGAVRAGRAQPAAGQASTPCHLRSPSRVRAGQTSFPESQDARRRKPGYHRHQECLIPAGPPVISTCRRLGLDCLLRLSRIPLSARFRGAVTAPSCPVYRYIGRIAFGIPSRR
jgi:hypothetical protein